MLDRHGKNFMRCQHLVPIQRQVLDAVLAILEIVQSQAQANSKKAENVRKSSGFINLIYAQASIKLKHPAAPSPPRISFVRLRPALLGDG